MNRSQKIVLKFSLGLALLIGLFPPWTFIVELGPIHRSQHAGYYFLFGSPNVSKYRTSPNTLISVELQKDVQVRLDFARLAAEWLTLLIASGLLLVLLKGKDPAKGDGSRLENTFTSRNSSAIQ